MSLNIKHPEADRLARALADKTGESITEAVIVALQERLLREEGRNRPVSLREELLKIGQRCAALPDIDSRTPDEILGYDEIGVPGNSYAKSKRLRPSLTKVSERIVVPNKHQTKKNK